MRFWWGLFLATVVGVVAGCGSTSEIDRSGAAPTIVDGNARFMVLSPRVIRLEYAAEGAFEDRPTFFIQNRTATEVSVRTRVESGWRVVETSKAQVRYRRGSGPFDSTNVEVRVATQGDTIEGHPTWPTRPSCRPGRVCQAEYGWKGGGVRRNSNFAWYTGPGFVENVDDGHVGWSLEGEGPDSVVVGLRYAALSSNTIQVSGSGVGETWELSATDGWADWAVHRDTVPWRPGRLEVGCAECRVHIDYLALSRVGTALPQPGPAERKQPLSGWRHGLGNQNEAIPLYSGVVHRRGWALHDDSHIALQRRDTAWVTPRDRPASYRDGYLFAYGTDYRQALQDKARLAGSPPLLPRWALGIWYSRLYPHTAADYRDRILPKARARNLPLSTLVLDTDVKAPNRWRGWTWEEDLMPKPDSFFAWTERQDLTTALNIHPSIGADDPRYHTAQRVADSTLVDVQGKCPRWQGDTGPCVAWDWSRPSHTASYMAVHEPLREDGIDVWWLDWCCDASRVSMPGLTPDTWINEQYARERREHGKRGIVLSRIGSSWQGPESARPGAWATHRSAIHFTGDTYPTWDILAFEVEMTVREGMMGIPYVSHDIGSFHGGGPRADRISDEMYVRWVQFGTFQPVFRLHGHGPRLPWQFGARADSIASRFMRLRGALAPYLYTLSREAHDTGLPMVRDLPLHYPSYDAAYEADGQYLLGRQMLVAPVTKPGPESTTSVWIPPGTWAHWFTGRRYDGPAQVEVASPLDRMPVFVKEGGIIPMQSAGVGAQDRTGPLRLRVVAGEDGRTEVYSDAGTGLGYRHGQFTRRAVTWTDASQTLRIGATERKAYRGQPNRQPYRLHFDGVERPERVRVRVGKRRPAPPKDWRYEPGEGLTVRLSPQPVDVPITVSLAH